MIYQKLQLGEPPCFLISSSMFTFPAHMHVEIELYYCKCGSCEIIIDKKRYNITAGEVAIIGSMVSHEIVNLGGDDTSRCVMLQIGPAMLGGIFALLESQEFTNPIFDLKQEKYKILYELFNELAVLSEKKPPFYNLMVKGNIYNISAYILNEFVAEKTDSSVPKKLNSVSVVEKSLELIYNNYQRKLTVEEVAESCGYSKSNFCKIFKSITGDTFHNVLNNHRIKMACILLKDSDCSVEDIATRVGFADSKSLCRIFKTVKGVSPGQYKKDKIE